MLAEKIKDQILKRVELREISVSSLEKKAGVGAGTISSILNNRSKNPGIEALYAIAQVLGCSVDDLLKDEHITSSPLMPDKDEVNYAWVGKLFQQIIEKVASYIELKNYNPPLSRVLFILKESYIYLLTKKNKELDTEFLEWFIDQNIQG